ncbi:MAG: hypothetical protein ACR2MX_10600, partial [Cyclobacteriaceae bacterium]
MTWPDERWMHHVHALSAMCWYALLMVQPYLATHGKIKDHRTLGIIGFLLAGATAWSAIAILPMDVEFGDNGGFGPEFPGEFFYGIVSVELIMMLAFVVAVIMAILKRKNTEDHALWLITTVFYIMHPGLGRGVMAVMFATNSFTTLMTPISIAAALILLGLIVIGYRMKKLAHPAILLGIVVNIPTFFTYQLGQQSWYVEWLQGFMKY